MARVRFKVEGAQLETHNHLGPCPLCKAPLVPRTNRRTGAPFYGCARFPACDYTLDERTAGEIASGEYLDEEWW